MTDRRRQAKRAWLWVLLAGDLAFGAWSLWRWGINLGFGQSITIASVLLLVDRVDHNSTMLAGLTHAIGRRREDILMRQETPQTERMIRLASIQAADGKCSDCAFAKVAGDAAICRNWKSSEYQRRIGPQNSCEWYVRHDGASTFTH